MNRMTLRFHTLALASLLAVTSSPCVAEERVAEPGQLEFSGPGVVLPMIENATHPKVVVGMGDGEQYEFIVDTGASVNVLDSAVARSLGLEVVDETQIGAPGGPQIPGDVVRVPLAYVGDATIKDAEFVTMDLAAFSGGSTQGVLGVGLFREYLMQYDYGRNEIRVSRDELSAANPGVMSYTDVGGHIQVDMDVIGTAVPTHVDTGSMAGFTLPVELKESLPMHASGTGAAKARLVGGDREVTFGQLDGSIVFGGATYEDPQVGFMDPSPGYGNVGSRVLSDFIVSIDQANRLIGFQRVARGQDTGASNTPRRLGVRFRGFPGGSRPAIGYVEPDSLGARSGLLAGDVLLSLNDKPTEEYDMASLGRLFRSAEPLHMKIDRAGEIQIIEIQ